MGAIHPAVIFFVGAALVPFFKAKAQSIFVVGVALAALVNMLFFIEPQTGWSYPFLDFNIVLLRADTLSLFVGRIFALIGLLIILYSIHVRKNGHHISSFLCIGSSLGVVFAGDFFTFFIFWEMMAVTATILIWLKRDEGSLEAGFRYLIMHLIGAGVLLAGILLSYSSTGTMEIDVIRGGLPFAPILIGIGFKAAFIPLHTWMPDAYPKASFTAGVLLCVFTTKTAVYALARSFPGIEVVAYMGGIMALYGATFALLQSNARKLLSYMIISSVGFMVAGIGIGTQMGLDGGLSQVWNGILYTSLLFMCIGAVIYRTGKHDLTELGGLARKMPITTIACIIAALSMSGAPLFNGFVSEALIYKAAENHGALYWMLKLASVGTFLSFCRFTYFGFLKNKEIEVREAPLTMTIPMIIVAVLCVLGGVYPNLLVNILPYQSELHVYTWGKLMDSTLFFGVAGAIFFFGKKRFTPRRREIPDFEYIYIKTATNFLWFCRNAVSILNSWVDLAYSRVARGFLGFCRNPVSSLATGVDSMFAWAARMFVGTARYSPLMAAEHLAGWMDRLSVAADNAATRGEEKRKMVTQGQAKVDVRSIDSAVFLVAVMILIFLVYMALVYIL